MAEEGCEAAGSGGEKGFSAMVRGVFWWGSAEGGAGLFW